jgi:hypothetical protein
MNKILFHNSFYIIPDVPGTISWYGNSMEYTLSGKFNPLTVYTVGISYIAEDLSGNTLDGNGDGIAEKDPDDGYIFGFKTSNITIIQNRPVLSEIKPGNGDQDVALSQPIELTFSMSMNNSEELFLFGCVPDPGGWERSWNADRTKVTLMHNKFAKNTDYTFTLFFAVGENGFEVGDTPIIIEFRSSSTDTSAPDEDGTYTLAGRDISYDTFMRILLVIFIWVVIIVIIAGWTLIKMRYKSIEEKSKKGREDESTDEEDEKGDDDIKILDEDLEELPPPEDDVPVVEAEDTEDSDEAEVSDDALEAEVEAAIAEESEDTSGSAVEDLEDTKDSEDSLEEEAEAALTEESEDAEETDS